ncbi:hypothetical protein ABIC63_000520 [Pseudacidovorax sp. 1753]|uniref:hypothetical protein n=1 Tax=Pseudacidovorax sp. 1753 TaxID=3156419 RepID=UPI00339A25E0
MNWLNRIQDAIDQKNQAAEEARRAEEKKSQDEQNARAVSARVIQQIVAPTFRRAAQKLIENKQWADVPMLEGPNGPIVEIRWGTRKPAVFPDHSYYDAVVFSILSVGEIEAKYADAGEAFEAIVLPDQITTEWVENLLGDKISQSFGK